MSTYLVTGGAGFIGRYLCEELLGHGHSVRVIDSLVEQVHGDTPPDLPPEIDFIHADLRDACAVRSALSGADGVFHLAAEVGVGQSMYEIARYVGGNDLATAVLLEQLSQCKIGRLVVASSMSVYGEGQYVSPDGVRQASVQRAARLDGAWDPVNPQGEMLTPVPTDERKQVDLASIYALTKYVQERSCMMIGASYGVESVALRLFNVFGAGQALSNPYTGVLANFGARLLNRQPPMVFEDGEQRRDFVHVRDVAHAFVLAMETPAAAGHVFNIGSGRTYTINQVARLLAAAMGVAELHPKLLGKARAGDIRHCFADIGKARTLLGFAPEHPLEATIGEFAEWVRASRAPDRGEVARRQLEAHGLVA